MTIFLTLAALLRQSQELLESTETMYAAIEDAADTHEGLALVHAHGLAAQIATTAQSLVNHLDEKLDHRGAA